MTVMTITKDNFEAEVMRADRPVLLDFWASWCGPCRTASPVVDKFAGESTGVKVGKVNVDEEPELAQIFGVMSVPSLFVLKGGKVTQNAVGVPTVEQLRQMVE